MLFKRVDQLPSLIFGPSFPSSTPPVLGVLFSFYSKWLSRNRCNVQGAWPIKVLNIINCATDTLSLLLHISSIISAHATWFYPIQSISALVIWAKYWKPGPCLNSFLPTMPITQQLPTTLLYHCWSEPWCQHLWGHSPQPLGQQSFIQHNTFSSHIMRWWIHLIQLLHQARVAWHGRNVRRWLPWWHNEMTMRDVDLSYSIILHTWTCSAECIAFFV